MTAVRPRQRTGALVLLFLITAFGPMWWFATSSQDNVSVPFETTLASARLMWAIVGLAVLVGFFWWAVTEATYEPTTTKPFRFSVAAVALTIAASHVVAFAVAPRWLASAPAWATTPVTYAVGAATSLSLAHMITRDRDDAGGFGNASLAQRFPEEPAHHDPFADPAERFFGG